VEDEQSVAYVFRDAEGSLYLIRDDVFEACRIEGGDLDYARRFEEQGVNEGFHLSDGPFTAYSRIDDTCATHPYDVCEPRPDPPSTLMCAW
jgi:hypothetical protein